MNILKAKDFFSVIFYWEKKTLARPCSHGGNKEYRTTAMLCYFTEDARWCRLSNKGLHALATTGV